MPTYSSGFGGTHLSTRCAPIILLQITLSSTLWILMIHQVLLKMLNTLTNLVGGTAAAGTTLEDLLCTVAPELSLPTFMQSWLQVDVSLLIRLFFLFNAILSTIEFAKRTTLGLCSQLLPFLFVSVTISTNDKLSHDVSFWLSHTMLPQHALRAVKASTEQVEDSRIIYWGRTSKRDDCASQKRSPIKYHPPPGVTRFWFRGRLFTVHYASSPAGTSYGKGNRSAPEVEEIMIVACLGFSTGCIQKFLEECRDSRERLTEGQVSIFTSKSQPGPASWDTEMLKAKRPLETVYFNQNKKEEFIQDIENYLSPGFEKRVRSCGIPYRRGYLLYGPPGCGKSSFVLALAGHFRLSVYMLSLPSVASDNTLSSLFSRLPPRCILLIEDIDACGLQNRTLSNDFDDEQDNLRRNRSAVTLSGLLNEIDGVSSPEGRLLFMTTNDLGALDPALVRPGRIDQMLCMGNIDRESARSMFLTMCRKPESGDIEEMANQFCQQIPDEVSPAKLQGFLAKNMDNPRNAVEMVDSLFAKKSPTSLRAKPIRRAC